VSLVLTFYKYAKIQEGKLPAPSEILPIAEVIVEFVPLLKEKLGTFTWIVSGIISERLPMVLGALEEHGFTVTKRKDRGEWVALEAKI
jgi:ribosomal protein L11 methylase PrmA